MLLKKGVRRPLARAALADRLPAAVLDERRKGYQAADWSEGMGARPAPASRALIDRIAADPTAAAIGRRRPASFAGAKLAAGRLVGPAR